jgi:hypothetical protein
VRSSTPGRAGRRYPQRSIQVEEKNWLNAHIGPTLLQLRLARPHGTSTAISSSAVESVRPCANLRAFNHHFTLDGILDAYDTFGHAANTGALKVIIAA